MNLSASTESHGLSKSGSFMGHHIGTKRRRSHSHQRIQFSPFGGMLEKIAVNLLAGVPALVKPATITSYLTEAVVKKS